MTHFNLAAPADLFTFARRGGHARIKSYRRFATGAEAIKFAVEDQSSDVLKHSIVESDDDRLEAAQIAELYDDAEFPLPRRLSP